MTPRVVVLAAPSGGGKTTIARELRTRAPETFGYSVSATTRKARPGERDGEAYHFLTRPEFERRREAGEFLEATEYAGELYGTLRSEVEQVLRSGQHVVLDVEVTGARQVRKAYPRPASVVLFVIPPSPRVLIERLRKRRTESEAELSRRIGIATHEVETARREIGDVYDRVLVNDDLDTAAPDFVTPCSLHEAIDQKHGRNPALRPVNAAAQIAGQEVLGMARCGDHVLIETR